MDKKKLRTLITFAIVFLLIPALVLLGVNMSGRSYYLISTLVMLLTCAPFFMLFESRKPQAREIVTLAVLCALAVASRAVFTFLPHFKPLMGIVMVASMAYGAEAGFLVGSISGFASNFFFGQGPWTTWQMFAYGTGGFLMGLLFSPKRLAKRRQNSAKTARFWPALAGFFIVFIVVGPLLDTCSLFTMAASITKEAAAIIYFYGLPVNFTHALSTFVTLFLVGAPLLEKLRRINTKYGLMDTM